MAWTEAFQFVTIKQTLACYIGFTLIKVHFYDPYFLNFCGNANHQVKPTSSRIYECLLSGTIVVDTLCIYFICIVLNLMSIFSYYEM